MFEQPIYIPDEALERKPFREFKDLCLCPPNLIIIGFAGYKRHGKTLSARLLTESLDPNFYQCTTRNFAEPIRNLCKDYFDLEINSDMEEKEKEKQIPRLGNHSPRHIMQMTGDFFRSIQSEYFTDIMKQKIKSFNPTWPKAGVFFIDDVRYPNEVKVIKDLGGEIWLAKKFQSYEALDEEDWNCGNIDGHSSERPLPKELIDEEIWWVQDDLNYLTMQLEKAFKRRFTN